MKGIGCLIVIILVVAMVIWAMTKDMNDEQRAKWVGEKAHRGYNKAKEFAGQAQEGWKRVPEQGTTRKSSP